LLFLIILPIVLIHQNSESSLGWLDFAGLIIWLIGFYFEYVGDSQLASFIKNPQNKGKLMQSGLWAYTRHPNYFGEVTQWWGLWLITLSAPNSILGIIGPITITVLILKISGIPMLEKKMAEKPEFKEYERKVSKFFPLPTRK
jgi:steroid 5-alpha reductase family enzyme